jgi:hypothetical protein
VNVVVPGMPATTAGAAGSLMRPYTPSVAVAAAPPCVALSMTIPYPLTVKLNVGLGPESVCDAGPRMAAFDDVSVTAAPAEVGISTVAPSASETAEGTVMFGAAGGVGGTGVGVADGDGETLGAGVGDASGVAVGAGEGDGDRITGGSAELSSW